MSDRDRVECSVSGCWVAWLASKPCVFCGKSQTSWLSLRFPPRHPAYVAIAFACICLLAILPGCKSKAAPAGPRPRIISHSPAITRIIFDMGLADHLVGVSNWCDLPAGADIPRVGDMQGIRAEAAVSLQPDIILTQSGRDKKLFAAVERMLPEMKIEYLRIESLDDILAAVATIGKLTGRDDLAAETQAKAIKNILLARKHVKQLPSPSPRVLFVSGYAHPMAAGPGTFIGDMITLGGGENASGAIPGNGLWRKAKVESIIKTAPDVLIVKVAPARRAEAKEFWLRQKDIPAARTGRVHIVTDDQWLRPSTGIFPLAVDMAKMIWPPEHKIKTRK